MQVFEGRRVGTQATGTRLENVHESRSGTKKLKRKKEIIKQGSNKYQVYLNTGVDSRAIAKVQ